MSDGPTLVCMRADTSRETVEKNASRLGRVVRTSNCNECSAEILYTDHDTANIAVVSGAYPRLICQDCLLKETQQDEQVGTAAIFSDDMLQQLMSEAHHADVLAAKVCYVATTINLVWGVNDEKFNEIFVETAIRYLSDSVGNGLSEGDKKELFRYLEENYDEANPILGSYVEDGDFEGMLRFSVSSFELKQRAQVLSLLLYHLLGNSKTTQMMREWISNTLKGEKDSE